MSALCQADTGKAPASPSLTPIHSQPTHTAPVLSRYDPGCGAWGQESGPCLGAVAAGQSFGGPLCADASGPSTTGVFINNRQIHALDVFRLEAMGITALPGRWWFTADGRWGLEGKSDTLGTLPPGDMASRGAGSNSWSWTNSENFGW